MRLENSEIPSSAEVLTSLLFRLDETVPGLAARVRNAVNEGHVPPKNPNEFREQNNEQVVRYTDKEALEVALQVLHAHFIEVPMFINAAHDEFQQASMSVSDKSQLHPSWYAREVKEHLVDQGEQKVISIERVAETTILRTQEENQEGESYILERINPRLIEEQRIHFDILRKLVQSLRA